MVRKDKLCSSLDFILHVLNRFQKACPNRDRTVKGISSAHWESLTRKFRSSLPLHSMGPAQTPIRSYTSSSGCLVTSLSFGSCVWRVESESSLAWDPDFSGSGSMAVESLGKSTFSRTSRACLWPVCLVWRWRRCRA